MSGDAVGPERGEAVVFTSIDSVAPDWSSTAGMQVANAAMSRLGGGAT